ncbi:hypothetical protein B0A55_09792 [Friedmanniomyces simplex]|uniref:Uncharacterized protein n=1 Tax=Friedmanniomyces simplex TaxID=329884 RepID=A0A4V5NE72_9PEZI|nr:hypothetical protein B0A55_09792 [Friedmanniomyces simplex]
MELTGIMHGQRRIAGSTSKDAVRGQRRVNQQRKDRKSPQVTAKQSRRHLELLWLSRVCKTASHELGHCFGIDHCTYYACVMQGTAGLSEDARQPPYVCPVDTAKLLTATGADEMDWLRALLNFCERFGEDALFAAFAAWLRMRLAELGMGYMEE